MKTCQEEGSPQIFEKGLIVTKRISRISTSYRAAGHWARPVSTGLSAQSSIAFLDDVYETRSLELPKFEWIPPGVIFRTARITPVLSAYILLP